MPKRKLGEFDNLKRTRRFQLRKNLQNVLDRIDDSDNSVDSSEDISCADAEAPKKKDDASETGESFDELEDSELEETTSYHEGATTTHSQGEAHLEDESCVDPGLEEESRADSDPEQEGLAGVPPEEERRADLPPEDLRLMTEEWDMEEEFFDFSDEEVDEPEDISDEEVDGPEDISDEEGQRREEEDESLLRGDDPLYEGSPLTLVESLLAVLTLSIVHNLTGTCLADILSLIYMHCKKPTIFRETLFKFRSFFLKIKSPVVRHYYCSQCLTYLDNPDAPCSCDNDRDVSYFIEIPIVSQLANFFSRKGFYEKLQHRFYRQCEEGSIQDVYDGELYKKLFRPGKFLWEKSNISFTWFSDGVPIFKSKKFSLWPIYLTINELPYEERIRKENIIVAGLWFGASDPVVNLFLRPTYTEMQMLHSTGVQIKPFGAREAVRVKAVLLHGTADTPARSDFLCHIRFNGDYGCTICKIKGCSISGEGYGKTHIYPFEGTCDMRTQKESDRYAEIAKESNKTHFGIKGPSLLSKIMPDAVRGVGIDVMHCVFLGVVKKLMLIWFDSKLRFERFSLYRHLNVIDSRIANINPPSFVQRLPRSIAQHLAYFKASEFKNFFFYYSVVVLHDVMEADYFDHYVKLVMGIFLLSRENTTDTMLMDAQKFLTAFVSQFQNLYDARFLSINVHLLLHLPHVVKNSGPLWVTTCFPFEDLNGKIVRSIHGTRQVGLQVYSMVAHSVAIPYLVSQLAESPAKAFCSRLLAYKHKRKLTEVGENMYIVGFVKRCVEVSLEISRALDLAQVNYEKVSVFHRLQRGKHVFSSTSYTRRRSNVDNCVLIEDDYKVKSVGIIKTFVRICECRLQACNADCSPSYFAIVKIGTIRECFSVSDSMIVEDRSRLRRVPYLHSFLPGEETSLVPVTHLKHLCFFVTVGTRTYVAEPVNLIETE